MVRKKHLYFIIRDQKEISISKFKFYLILFFSKRYGNTIDYCDHCDYCIIHRLVPFFKVPDLKL